MPRTLPSEHELHVAELITVIPADSPGAPSRLASLKRLAVHEPDDALTPVYVDAARRYEELVRAACIQEEIAA